MSKFDRANFLGELLNAIKESLTSLAEGPKIHLNPFESKHGKDDEKEDKHGEHEEEVLPSKGRPIPIKEAVKRRVHRVMKKDLRVRTLKGNVVELQQGQHVGIMPLNEGADPSEQRFLITGKLRSALHVGLVVMRAVTGASTVIKPNNASGKQQQQQKQNKQGMGGGAGGGPGMKGSKQGKAGTSSTRPNGTMTPRPKKAKVTVPKIKKAKPNVSSRPKRVSKPKVGPQQRKSTGNIRPKPIKTPAATAIKRKPSNTSTVKRLKNTTAKPKKPKINTAAETLVFQPKRGDVVQTVGNSVPDSRVSDVSGDKVMLACRNFLFGVNKQDVSVLNRVEPALTSGNVKGSSFVVWLVKDVPSHPLRAQQ